jgi:MFS family permease
MPLGALSDRIGRKPVVLFGLGQLSFTILLFGFGKSFTWLVVVKVFSGLLVSLTHFWNVKFIAKNEQFCLVRVVI